MKGLIRSKVTLTLIALVALAAVAAPMAFSVVSTHAAQGAKPHRCHG